MSALHWICALTLALVCCLSAQPVKRNAASKDALLQDLEALKIIAEKNCSKDTTLYSPSDIREDCLSSALECTIRELKVLENECNTKETPDDAEVLENLQTELSLGDWKVPLTSSPNCICEKLYPQIDVETFLNNIKDLVHQL